MLSAKRRYDCTLLCVARIPFITEHGTAVSLQHRLSCGSEFGLPTSNRHPSDLILLRAFQDSTIPLATPLRSSDGTMIDHIFVPKGSNVLLGVRACNRDKALWGHDAEVWKPERWLQPLPKAVEAASIPGVYSHLSVVLG